MNRLAPLMSSAKQDWQTPPAVLDLVRQVAPIEIDPCTTDDNPTGAEVWYTPAEDGLTRTWAGARLAYVNPPYSRALGPWMEKCHREALEAEIIALVPARPDTRWWHQHVVKRARAICFWRGRLRFVGASYSAPFPSALVCWSPWSDTTDRFFDVFLPHGWLVTP